MYMVVGRNRRRDVRIEHVYMFNRALRKGSGRALGFVCERCSM